MIMDESKAVSSYQWHEGKNAFEDFEPIALPAFEETDDAEDEEEYDEAEEFDINNLDDYAERPSRKFYLINQPSEPGVKCFTQEKFDAVNELLNGLRENFEIEDVREILSSDFVKKNGGIANAFKNVSYYVNEVRQAHRYRRLFDIMITIAKNAGATEAELEELKKLDQTEVEQTFIKPKRECWDEAFNECESLVLDETKEASDDVEKMSDEEEEDERPTEMGNTVAAVDNNTIQIDDDEDDVICLD